MFYNVFRQWLQSHSFQPQSLVFLPHSSQYIQQYQHIRNDHCPSYSPVYFLFDFRHFTRTNFPRVICLVLFSLAFFQAITSLVDRYGDTRTEFLLRLLAIFVAIANYEPLAINEIADLMFMNGVKLEPLDLLTDIKPLLYEERETDFEGVIEGQKNRYRLVNDNVRMGVLEYLGNEFSVQLEMILDVYSSELHKELLEEQCEGFQVVTAHLYDIVTEYNTNFTITENEYKSICYYIATKKK